MQNGENHVSSPDHNVKPKDAKKLFDGANNISLSGTQRSVTNSKYTHMHTHAYTYTTP